MTAMKSVCGLIAAIVLVFGNGAVAQQFSGQVVSIIVNYPAGGPADIEARLVARHLPKYLQGVRSIVVRNVSGGSGNIGVNQLGEASERDRLSLGYFTWDPVAQLIQDESLHVRYNDLRFIAGIRQVSLLYIRRDTPPGISRSADVAKAPIVKVGALGPNNQATLRLRFALDLLGVKYETIAGYKGLLETELGIRRGDLHATLTSLPSWHASVKPNLIDTGIAMPLYQYDYDRPDGTPGRNPDLPDVPAFSELFREIKGAAAVPSGERWQALQMLTRFMDGMFRAMFMPPNAPTAAVEEMRAAMGKLANDAEFLADYQKIVRTPLRIIIGAPGEAILSELGKMQPSFLNFLRKYVEAGQ